jgi:predicted cupin superfamily sugar epimerase
VTPGFEYADFEIGRSDVLLAGWPQAAAVIGELT